MHNPGELPGSGKTHTIRRRDFIQLSAAATIALGLAQETSAKEELRSGANTENSCILIFNLGGMSHLDTFDPKPDAPREVRGPFKAIRTQTPEFEISELFPLHAKIADQFSLVRTCHHASNSDHDNARFLMETGVPFDQRKITPHLGMVIGQALGGRNQMPAHMFLPETVGLTGGPGCSAIHPAGRALVPNSPELEFYPGAGEALDLGSERDTTRDRYGRNRMGDNLLRARRLIERGVRCVTVNSFTTLFNEPSWDIHGFKPFSSFSTMRDFVAPMYDRAYSALIEDLQQRGLLKSTLVAAISEFGRTPRINAAGGRDHWSACFTSYFAGAGIKGGRAIGKSDRHGAFPADRPVTPEELVATIYCSMGVERDPRAGLSSHRDLVIRDRPIA